MKNSANVELRIRVSAAMTLAVTALSFASIFITKLETAEVPPLVIAFYRMAITTVLLLPPALAFKRKEIASLARKDFGLLALGGLFLLLRYAWRSRGRVLSLTAPILYPMLFLMIAYSLSAGNAGTGFRYRTHLVVLGAAMLVVLREHALRVRAESREPASVPPDVAPEPLVSRPLPA